MDNKTTIFEKHPKKTLVVLSMLILLIVYGLISWKIIQNQYTEFEKKNLKTILHQYYVGKIIDNNIGRFIKLREHPPNQILQDRPSRNYLSKIAPNSVERKYYTLSMDKHGFIGPSEIHADPELKIVFLGGSTTECLYMEENERFPYLVGRKLEQKLHKRVNSYNGGVSANETMHSLNILMNKVLPMKPNIVVMMENINDLDILRAQGDYGYENSLKSHVQTAKNVFTKFQFPPIPKAVEEGVMIREFGRNLLTFIAICKIRDITPVLMTQANRVKEDKLYHRFNDVIREIGAKENVLVIDLAASIPPQTQYLYDRVHYTARGSALASEIISTRLAIATESKTVAAN